MAKRFASAAWIIRYNRYNTPKSEIEKKDGYDKSLLCELFLNKNRSLLDVDVVAALFEWDDCIKTEIKEESKKTKRIAYINHPIIKIPTPLLTFPIYIWPTPLKKNKPKKSASINATPPLLNEINAWTMKMIKIPSIKKHTFNLRIS